MVDQKSAPKFWCRLFLSSAFQAGERPGPGRLKAFDPLVNGALIGKVKLSGGIAKQEFIIDDGAYNLQPELRSVVTRFPCQPVNAVLLPCGNPAANRRAAHAKTVSRLTITIPAVEIMRDNGEP